MVNRLLLDDLLAAQDGVVSRRQVLGAGFDDNFIEREIRRREWVRVYRGVFVNHTGPLTWLQRAWAAVLFYWPAVLSHDSAVYPDDPSRAQVIHVAVEHSRNPAGRLPDVEVHRSSGLDTRALWNLGPPRMRLDEAVLDIRAKATSRLDALAVVTDVCQRRRTTAGRLLATLGRRQRMRHGKWLRQALADVATGALSVLEHAYLNRVERAHGPPRGRRQKPGQGSDGVVYRDVEYDEFALIVELDGRLWHDGVRKRAKDMDRDLDAAADGRDSVRVSWAQCVDTPCATAGRLGRLLQRRGWRGTVHPCSPDCALRGRFPAPDAGNLPHRDAS